MKQWFRKNMPHPDYKNWCGKNNTHEKWCGAPVADFGDAACRVHDFALREAKGQDDRNKADIQLYESWKAWKPKKLWSKIYRLGILLVFKPRR